MSRSVTMRVTNEIGLHARPAAKLVEKLNKFRCDVYLEKDGERVNAKSIIGLLTLAAGNGAEVIAHLDGPDEEACLQFLVEYFASGFGEAYA